MAWPGRRRRVGGTIDASIPFGSLGDIVSVMNERAKWATPAIRVSPAEWALLSQGGNCFVNYLGEPVSRWAGRRIVIDPKL